MLPSSSITASIPSSTSTTRHPSPDNSTSFTATALFVEGKTNEPLRLRESSSSSSSIPEIAPHPIISHKKESIKKEKPWQKCDIIGISPTPPKRTKIVFFLESLIPYICGEENTTPAIKPFIKINSQLNDEISEFNKLLEKAVDIQKVHLLVYRAENILFKIFLKNPEYIQRIICEVVKPSENLGSTIFDWFLQNNLILKMPSECLNFLLYNLFKHNDANAFYKIVMNSNHFNLTLMMSSLKFSERQKRINPFCREDTIEKLVNLISPFFTMESPEKTIFIKKCLQASSEDVTFLNKILPMIYDTNLLDNSSHIILSKIIHLGIDKFSRENIVHILTKPPISFQNEDNTPQNRTDVSIDFIKNLFEEISIKHNLHELIQLEDFKYYNYDILTTLLDKIIATNVTVRSPNFLRNFYKLYQFKSASDIANKLEQLSIYISRHFNVSYLSQIANVWYSQFALNSKENTTQEVIEKYEDLKKSYTTFIEKYKEKKYEDIKCKVEEARKKENELSFFKNPIEYWFSRRLRLKLQADIKKSNQMIDKQTQKFFSHLDKLCKIKTLDYLLNMPYKEFEKEKPFLEPVLKFLNKKRTWWHRIFFFFLPCKSYGIIKSYIEIELKETEKIDLEKSKLQIEFQKNLGFLIIIP